ncbi:MAG: PTS system mannose/fructose/sorbose family transporter subunit IID [Elusimicrobia bacterium]|nr:PTS system mannose/fructose/sorbose family transporter subunit IID [Elusimicrobiota bacterium]
MDRRLQSRIFTRSFLMQACWSFERMQNLGFLFAIEPWLDRIYPEPERRRAAAARHLEFFNTQPYMASWTLGVVGALEERLARSPEQDRPTAEARLGALKKAMASALAAVGDTLFWGALRPACAAVAIAAWGLFWTAGLPHPILAGCLLYLALFNIPALWTRWQGIRLGYLWQESLSAELGRYRWQRAAVWIRIAGLSAAVLTALAALLVPPWGAFSRWSVAVLGACVALKAAGVSAGRIYLGLIALGTVLAAADAA